LAALPLIDWIGAVLSAALLILAFPNFELWPLAAVGLVPLLLVVTMRPRPWRSFLLGWLTGTAFFYGSCYWLTYSMIHYGDIPTVLAYLFLIPVTLVVGLFPGIFAMVLSLAVRRWGLVALFGAPILWPALEWARLGITGQLWNALAYSQAYHPNLIQAARWGGVYSVSFHLIAINSAIAFFLIRRTAKSAVVAGALIVCTILIGLYSPRGMKNSSDPEAVVSALQPNVPMDLVKSAAEMQALRDRHMSMTESALNKIRDQSMTRLVVWPESPMNFAYGSDAQLREVLRGFAIKNKTSILFNSQEPAPNDGIYNSALYVNEHGQLIAQYD
jgi:apolipoprotein N-acyltransferase